MLVRCLDDVARFTEVDTILCMKMALQDKQAQKTARTHLRLDYPYVIQLTCLEGRHNSEPARYNVAGLFTLDAALAALHKLIVGAHEELRTGKECLVDVRDCQVQGVPDVTPAMTGERTRVIQLKQGDTNEVQPENDQERAVMEYLHELVKQYQAQRPTQAQNSMQAIRSAYQDWDRNSDIYRARSDMRPVVRLQGEQSMVTATDRDGTLAGFTPADIELLTALGMSGRTRAADEDPRRTQPADGAADPLERYPRERTQPATPDPEPQQERAEAPAVTDVSAQRDAISAASAIMRARLTRGDRRLS